MSIVNWRTTSAEIKLKQYEIVTRADKIILKRDGSNFTAWIESQATHCSDVELDSILYVGPAEGIDDSYPVHSKFLTRETLFDIYGRVTLEEVTLLSKEIMAKTDAAGLIEIQKVKCLCKRLFNSSDNELQNHLSINANHQAMKADDANFFKEAMDVEIKSFNDENIFTLMPISNKPNDKSLIPFVWSFKRKKECSW